MPEQDIAMVVRQEWERHLGAPPTAGEENFFAAGGNSLQAAELMMSLSEVFGKRLRLALLVSNPAFTQLTEAVTAALDR